MIGLTPAASAMVIHGNKVLFVRSTRTQDLWAFPGGRREGVETPEQTAIREVKEEVGLDIDITGDLGTYTLGSGFEIRCFAAGSATTELHIDSSEILEARWLTVNEALGLNLVPTVLEALERFVSTADRDPAQKSGYGD